MTDQLTDEYLEKRAGELTDKRFPKFTNVYGKQNPHTLTKINLRNGFREATLDALKVHRDGLRVLERCNHNLMCPALPLGKISSEEVGDCNCGLDQHIASLRELLGLN